MTRIFFDGRDLEIAIRHGGVEHVLPVSALAAFLGLDSALLATRITLLFKARRHLSTDAPVLSHPAVPDPSAILSGEPTEGVVQPTKPNQEEKYLTHHTNQPNHGSDVVERASDLALDAHDLQAALGDDANLTALASTVRDVPVPIVREALAQALAVPSTRLRASRAALFTAIVRRMSPKNSNPSPYARTPSSST